MKNKKSAEEMLDKLLIERGEHPTRVRNPLYWEERQLAKSFAAQELADYKAKLKEAVSKRQLYGETTNLVKRYEILNLIDKL